MRISKKKASKLFIRKKRKNGEVRFYLIIKHMQNQVKLEKQICRVTNAL